MNDIKEKNMNSKISKVWLSFAIYLIGYFAIMILSGDQSLAWLELEAFSLIISIAMLIRHRLPSKRGIILSIAVTMLYGLARIYSFNFFVIIQMFIMLMAAMACCSVFEKYKDNALIFIRNDKRSDIVISILIGVAAGIVMAFINYLLMKGSNTRTEPDYLKAFINALSPATMEEIALRSTFYAFCLDAAKGSFANKAEKFTSWFMMIVPHIIPHILFDISLGIEGMIQWIIIMILYILVFGLLFAILQRKRDIASAMIVHGIVDFIRFVLFGVPGL